MAGAQEDPETEPAPAAPIYNSDRVLVATLQPESDAAEADARRLEGLLVERLTRSNAVASMSAVPRFMPQDYSAETYMLGCPPGKYAGCELVVGQRIDVDRVVGGTVRRDADDFEEGKSLLVFTVHLVDVREAREIASFGVPVPADREVETIDGIARVFDEVVRGDYELRDLRPDGPTEEDLALEAERRDRLAASLAALEAELGTAVRSDEVGRIAAPKVTRDDLAAYVGREETPPWERLRMSQNAYLRYANSGQDVMTWRREGLGRFGKVLLRGSVGGGGGPWHQQYTGEVLLSNVDLSVVDAVQLLEVINASSFAGDLEVGFGVAPMIDVSFAATVRNGQTTYALDEDVQTQVALPTKPRTYGMSTWQFGPRVQLAPFPRWPARPTVGMGIGFWSGAGIPESERFPRMDAPSATLLEVIPGVEAEATPIVALSLRGILALPLANHYQARTELGDRIMEDPPEPTGQFGMGFTVVGGLLVRIGPVWGDRMVKPIGGEMWDDEELDE